MMNEAELQSIRKRLFSKDERVSEDAFEEVKRLETPDLCALVELQKRATQESSKITRILSFIFIMYCTSIGLQARLWHYADAVYYIMLSIYLSIILMAMVKNSYKLNPKVNRDDMLYQYLFESIQQTPLSLENLPILLWAYYQGADI